MDVAVSNPTVDVPKKQLLRYHQREELKGEIESMESMLPNLKTPTDRGEVSKRLKRLHQSLVTQSPQELPGELKNKLYQESKSLEFELSTGMLSQEEMRKNPAGAVGQHMRWERANKSKILRWKNIQQMLDPTSDDPDLSNFERFRPAGAMDRLRTDAQIKGHMSYGSVPQEKWDMAFDGKGPTNTALQQAQRVNEEIGEKKKKNYVYTPAQKELMRQRLAVAREKKLAMLARGEKIGKAKEAEQAKQTMNSEVN
jgi:hypothetical protein